MSAMIGLLVVAIVLAVLVAVVMIGGAVLILRRAAKAPPGDGTANGNDGDAHNQQVFMHDSFGSWD